MTPRPGDKPGTASGYANMIGTAFQESGVALGVDLWRVRKTKLVKAEKDDEALTSGILRKQDSVVVLKLVKAEKDDEALTSGILRKQDSVVVLHTIEEKDGWVWHVHTWTGSESSMVGSGLAGSMAAKLCNLLEVNVASKKVVRSDSTEGSATAGLGAAFKALGKKMTVEAGCFAPVVVVAKAEKPVKLWLLDEGVFQRVPLAMESLDSTKSLVLDTGRMRPPSVYSWGGAKCGRVERAVAEEFCRRVAAREYGDAGIAHWAHVHEGDAGEYFVKQIIKSNVNPDDVAHSSFKSPLRLAPTLHSWTQEGGWVALSHDGEGDPVGRPGAKLAVTTLTSEGVFAIDCFDEAWIWLGRSYATDFNDSVALKKKCVDDFKATQGQRPPWFSVETVRERFESVALKERMYGWLDDEVEVRGNVKMKHDEPKRMRTEKTLESEADRMTSAGLGSLEASLDTSDTWKDGEVGRAGDDARSGLPLELADDDEATLEIFTVTDDGHAKLVKVKQEHSEWCCWTSSDMLVLVFTCKRGAVHVVYTWEGKTASLRMRTAAGLKVQTLRVDLKLQGAEHQLYARQGAEPALLLAVLARKLARKRLCVLEGKQRGGYLREVQAEGSSHGVLVVGDSLSRVRVLKIAGANGIDKPDARLVKAAEESLETTRAAGRFDPNAAYLLAKRDMETGHFDLQFFNGSLASNAVKEHAKSLFDSKDLPEWLEASAEQCSVVLSAAAKKPETPPPPPPPPPPAPAPAAPAPAVRASLKTSFWGKKKKSVPAVVVVAPVVVAADVAPAAAAAVEKETTECTRGPLTSAEFFGLPESFLSGTEEEEGKKASRPARLFEVSRAKRQVGAMFVTDLGRNFGQGDIVQRGTYLLDPGAGEVFVWLGAEATTPECELALGVGAVYSLAVPSMASYYTTKEELDEKAEVAKRPESAYNVVKLRVATKQKRRVKGSQLFEAPSVVAVDAGREPGAFLDNFAGWELMQPAETPKVPGLEETLQGYLEDARNDVLVLSPPAVKLEDEQSNASSPTDAGSPTSGSSPAKSPTSKSTPTSAKSPPRAKSPAPSEKKSPPASAKNVMMMAKKKERPVSPVPAPEAAEPPAEVAQEEKNVAQEEKLVESETARTALAAELEESQRRIAELESELERMRAASRTSTSPPS